MAVATSTVLIAAAAAATMAGAGIGAYGQYQAGKAQQAMANYNAKVQQQTAEYNNKLAQNAAIAEEQAQSVRSQQMRDDKRRMLSSQRAGFAKTGAAMEGTPLTVLAEQAGMMEHDILLAKHESDVRARTYRQEGAMGLWTGRSQAAMSRFEGSQAAKAGRIGAGATLLSGAGSVAGMGMSYGARSGG
jgi:hypothetical protein